MKRYDRPGQPTLYRAEYVEQARKLCEKFGATDRELADFFGVCLATVANWKVEHPQFLDALKTSKEVADRRVVESLYQRALGYDVESKISLDDTGSEMVEIKHFPADPTSMIFWLKNRQPKDWRDKPEDETPPNTLKEPVLITRATKPDANSTD